MGQGTSGEELSVLKGLLAGGITLGFAAVFPEGLLFPFLAVLICTLATHAARPLDCERLSSTWDSAPCPSRVVNK